jgi:hypothetical protein
MFRLRSHCHLRQRDAPALQHEDTMPHAIFHPRGALPAAALLATLALAGCGTTASDASALDGQARPPAYPGNITLASEPPVSRYELYSTAAELFGHPHPTRWAHPDPPDRLLVGRRMPPIAEQLAALFVWESTG